MDNRSKKKKLSPAAKYIADLVATVGGGSQRAFAKMAGCTQPSISRILNGQQEPGRELVALIAEMDEVDSESLLATLSQAAFDVSNDFLIPIAACLLTSSPESCKDQLTSNTIAVPQATYQPSLYGVMGRSCTPAVNDPAEHIRNDDLMVIESSTVRFNQNIQMFNGRLCVIVDGDSPTLKRVWTKYVKEEKRWLLKSCSDDTIDDLHEHRFGGRRLRVIQLDPRENHPEEEKFVDATIDIKDIVGIAVQLIRNL